MGLHSAFQQNGFYCGGASGQGMVTFSDVFEVLKKDVKEEFPTLELLFVVPTQNGGESKRYIGTGRKPTLAKDKRVNKMLPRKIQMIRRDRVWTNFYLV